jgi:hypothetical protein
MWRRKKLIIFSVLAAVLLLVGTIGGVAVFAQNGSTSPSDSPGKTLLARVADILGIDQQKVEDAFAQAQREMQEEALDDYLKNLVDQGTITQEQADQYKTWWQSRPVLPFEFGFRSHGGFRGCPGPWTMQNTNSNIASNTNVSTY